MAPIMRCVSYPGMVKDGIGWAAFAGICATTMARQGFTSTPSLFALDQASPWVDSLGTEFFIQALYFKPYCCCRWAHAAVHAALKIAQEHAICLESIDRIQIETFAEACALSRRAPTTSEEAQYSVSYPVAAALLHGDVGPEQVLEGQFSDPRVVNLMSRIEFKYREDLQAEFPERRLAEVKIVTTERVYASGMVNAPGDPSSPLSDFTLREKFQKYASPHLSRLEIDDLLLRLEVLEDLPDLKPVTDLLCRISK
jgi:2-methylcitrate dehydratase PrpD